MKLRTILVWHDRTTGADNLVRTACGMVPREGGRIIVLAVTPIHPSLPLTGLPPTVDQKSAAALPRSQDIAAACGCTVECLLRHVRDTAHAVVRVARDIEADAIFASLDPPRLRWMAPRLSATAHHIMREAPCPVLLTYSPSRDTLDPWTVVGEAERILHGAS